MLGWRIVRRSQVVSEESSRPGAALLMEKIVNSDNLSARIRQADANDISALSELAIKTYVAAFGHSFSESDLAAHLAANLSPECFVLILERDVVLVAELDGKLIGFAQFGSLEDASTQDDDQELRRLYVLAGFQNQGIGGKLMQTVFEIPQFKSAERILLDVWEHNPAARRFYERYGFEVIGERRFDVESGIETSLDLIMERRRSSS